MNKNLRLVYAPLLLLLSACGMQVSYLGKSYPATQEAEVFVSKDAISKPYEVIGKGYIRTLTGGVPRAERIQRKAVEKAKQKGADAVLIEDYFVIDQAAGVVSNADSGRRTQRIAAATSAQPAFTISFIRYKKE